MKLLNLVRYNTSKYQEWVDKFDHVYTYNDINKQYDVAVVQVELQAPKKWADIIDQITCEKIIIIVQDLMPDVHKHIVLPNDRPGVHFVVHGKIRQPLTHATQSNMLSYFCDMTYLYMHTDVRHKTQWEEFCYNSIATKDYHFDFLPGTETPARKFAHDWIITNSKPNDFLHTGKFWKHHQEGPRLTEHINWDEGFWDDNIEHLGNCEALYHGHPVRIGQILPLQVYAKSKHSLICESHETMDYFFPTEKTAKPILAKRLFVVIGPQYFLRDLKELGFQTFSSVIDESYDAEPDPYKRWSMALEQTKSLCEPMSRYDLFKILPIVEHNFEHMMQLDFHAVASACRQIC